MIKYIKAIKAINPKAEFTFNDVDNITWLNGTTPISKSDIEQKISEIDYIDKRAKNYPSIVDQLDEIYHNGIDAWKETIKAVKDKYPKE